MKNKKRVLSLALVLFVLVLPMFAATETAEISLTTFVGENITNTGLRISASSDALTGNQAFDDEFFSSGSIITLNNTTLDSSLEEVTGQFSVLVRRQSQAAVMVDVIASPLLNGSNYLEYTLVNDGAEWYNKINLTIENTSKSEDYQTSGSTFNVIRDQSIFTYTIPADITAPVGFYTADITFSITTT